MQSGDVILRLLDGVLIVTVLVVVFQEARTLVFDDEAIIDGVSAAFDQADLVARLDGSADS